MFKIFLSLFLTLSLNAKEVGEFLYVKGVIKIKQGKKQANATKGQRFLNKSIIQSGKGALAVISLIDGSKIKLSENSKIIISIAPKRPTQVGIFKGSSFFNVLKSKVISKDKFIVKTKNAALGVRGTQFFVSYGKEDNNKSSDAWMCVNEGLVRVTPKDSSKSVEVKEGQGVHIKDSKSVSNPRALAWTRNLNWKFDSTNGELENKVNIEDAYSDPLDQDYD